MTYSYKTLRKIFKNIPASTRKKLHRYSFHNGYVYLNDPKWLKDFHKATRQELKNTRLFSEIREN